MPVSTCAANGGRDGPGDGGGGGGGAALLSGGTALLVYIVLMFVVPYAQTSEQHAAAHGLPFNARALVERAKAQAADFANHQDWRQSRDSWRREWKASRAAWKASWRRRGLRVSGSDDFSLW